MVKVSIVVPAYNAEKYIDKCLKSLINQTLKDIEIIVVNDGSKDNTLEKVNKYSDKRIKLLNLKENKGIGHARNEGIKKALGEYIGFVDSDDYVDNNMFEKMYEKASKEKLDIVVCDFYKQIENTNQTIKEIIPNFKNTNLKDNSNLLLDINLAPWNKIYKRELIVDNKIRFDEELKYEDVPFVVKSLDKAKNIGKLNKCLNYYVVHNKSETTIRDERIFDIIKIVDQVRKYFKYKKNYNDVVDELTIRILCNYNIQQRYQKNKKIRKKFIKESFQYLEKNIPNYQNNNYFKKRNIFKRIIEKNKIITNLYCMLYRINNYLNKKNIYIIASFIILFIISLITIKDVGGYNDEDAENNILRMNAIEYFELLGENNHYANKYKSWGLKPISESIERDHGIAPYYPFVFFFEYDATEFNSYLSSVLWHIYTYLIFFIGSIFLFLVLKMLLKSKYLALMGTLLYSLSPRMFADGLYNNKDMVLLSFLLAALYFGIKFIKNRKFKDAIFLGITSAFMCNIKVIGFYFLAVIGLFYIIWLFIEKKWNIRNFLVGLIAVIIFLILYIIITPAIWGSGKFLLIEHIKYGLQESSNFSRHGGPTVFEGLRIYDTKPYIPLPWYYLIKMIVITSPIIVTISFLIGFIYLVKNFIINIKNKKIELKNYGMLMILIILIVPLIIGTFSKPILYNGWRHFYFLYGPIIIIASYGILNLQKFNKIKIIYNILIFITLIFYLIVNIKNGIGCMAYYNFLVKNNSNNNYERDYYAVTTTDSLKSLVDFLDVDKVYLFSEEGSSILITNISKMTKNYKNKLIVLETKEDYLESIKKHPNETLYFYNYWHNKKNLKNKKLIYEYKKCGSPLSGYYK